MYEVPYNPPFILNDDGTNSPLEHQFVISRLTVELGVLYFHRHEIDLMPLPETPLAEGPGYPVPDIILLDRDTEKTYVVIEISNNRGFSTDVRKITRLIEEEDYGIQEGFVFNYKTREWLRYRKGDGGVATATAFSEVLNVDMGPMV